MSELEKEWKKLSDPRIVFIGVATAGESPQVLETFAQNYGITFPIWIDRSMNYARMGSDAFPLEVVIGADDVVVFLEPAYDVPGAVAAAKKAAAKAD